MTDTTGTPLPDHADVVVIGGGVVGLSTAYHLAKAGAGSVVLLDKGSFGAGSTCRAAGGVRAQFSDEVNIRLGLRSLATFERFGELFDQEIDLHRTGYLFLLDNADDVAEFERNVKLQNDLGVPSRMIDPAEAAELSPLISTDGLLAASFSPTDGHCTPESVCLGYARAGRGAGATLVANCAVTGAEVSGGTISAVLTEAGRIETDTVVCAAGPWSRAVGEWFGVDLPVDPLRRQILVTDAIPDLPRDLPMTIDFSTTFYFHNEGPGLLIGMSDPDETVGFKLDRDDAWLPGLSDAITHRAPLLADVGLASGWAGLYEMTPDHNGLVGSSTRTDRFFYATGFSGHGFLMGPALGEVMTDLVLGRPPVIDVSDLDVDRFAAGEARFEKNIV